MIRSDRGSERLASKVDWDCWCWCWDAAQRSKESPLLFILSLSRSRPPPSVWLLSVWALLTSPQLSVRRETNGDQSGRKRRPATSEKGTGVIRHYATLGPRGETKTSGLFLSSLGQTRKRVLLSLITPIPTVLSRPFFAITSTTSIRSASLSH
jgi:hypothetical protein